jgi:heparanase
MARSIKLSAAAALAAAGAHAQGLVAAPLALPPGAMPRIATVDERYQSYNVEMAEVVGGKFWKPYDKLSQGSTDRNAGNGVVQIGQDPSLFEARRPIDLSNRHLRMLAAALGPAYVRVSGTWANSTYFHDSDEPPPQAPPKGFQNVLTRAQWAGVIGFARAVNARIVTSFAISEGVRDSAGVWTPDQARKLLAATKAAGGEVAAAEMFNEPSFASIGGAPPGYDARAYARDFVVFRRFARASAPQMIILGPGSVGEGFTLMPGSLLKTADLLTAVPRPVFDAFSYHYYGATSVRCASLANGVVGTTPQAALTEEWLSRTDEVNSFYEDLRDRYEPDRTVWITETADAACGGNPWAPTFLDTFRYLDQLGRLAKRGVKVVMHNTLASSEYGLLDQNMFAPRPNYWAALLWRKLMGTSVLDAGPSGASVHLYAHCLRDRPGGVALLAINTSRTQPATIELPGSAERYTLTASKVDDSAVQLNGRQLQLDAAGELPPLRGVSVSGGSVELAPASITFLALPGARNSDCQ